MPDTKKTMRKDEKKLHEDEKIEAKHDTGKKGGASMQAGPNIVGAAMVGAIAGAAVGVATSMALSDEKTRKKAIEFMGDIRDKAADRLTQMSQTAKKTVNRLPEPIKDEVRKVAEDMTRN